MNTIVELETEHGTTLYVNPNHVASLVDVQGDGEPITVVWAGGTGWRVKGKALALAAHIFSVATEFGHGIIGFSKPGRALRKERVPLGSPCKAEAVIG